MTGLLALNQGCNLLGVMLGPAINLALLPLDVPLFDIPGLFLNPRTAAGWLAALVYVGLLLSFFCSFAEIETAERGADNDADASTADADADADAPLAPQPTIDAPPPADDAAVLLKPAAASVAAATVRRGAYREILLTRGGWFCLVVQVLASLTTTP